ncbi:MAG: RICIN domain-containing protein, partial [Flavobacterium sp.]
VSSVENTVSAYSSINEAADQMTVIIVNKDMNSAQNVTVNLNGFQVANGNYKTLQLSSLPENETFVSETQNALKTSQVGVNSNSLTISVPKLSTTAILLTKTAAPSVTYVTLANRGTNLLMDGMYRTDNGSNTGQYSKSGTTAQQWSIETVGNYVMLKNRATNLYLDGMYRKSNGSITGQYSYSGTDAQYWTRETAGSYVKFKNKATGLYIDGIGNKTNGADLAQWSSSSHFNQQWSINTVSSAKMSSISEQNSTEESSLPIVLYPNPFSSAITLKVDEPNKINDISIFDMTGKLVESIQHSEITSSMSIGSSLTSNIYIVKVSTTDGVKTFKIVKK